MEIVPKLQRKSQKTISRVLWKPYKIEKIVKVMDIGLNWKYSKKLATIFMENVHGSKMTRSWGSNWKLKNYENSYRNRARISEIIKT